MSELVIFDKIFSEWEDNSRDYLKSWKRISGDFYIYFYYDDDSCCWEVFDNLFDDISKDEIVPLINLVRQDIAATEEDMKIIIDDYLTQLEKMSLFR